MSAGTGDKITNFEKQIYNTYLSTTRGVQNKPWRPRLNFDKFPEVNLMYCRKISLKLTQFPWISLSDFFYAPFYEDRSIRINLEYFASMKSMNSYMRYMKYLESLPPDAPEILERVISSLRFINKYCMEHKITVSDYFNEMSGTIPTTIKHIKERRVWIYALLEFNEFSKMIQRCDIEVVRLMFGDDFFDRIEVCRFKYLNNKIAKKTIKLILKKLITT